MARQIASGALGSSPDVRKRMALFRLLGDAIGANLLTRERRGNQPQDHALQPTRLRVAFITHLHSDHTVGYPDLILTPWTLGRRVPTTA